MSRIVESGVFVSSSFGAEFRLLIGFLFGLLTGVACSVLPAADTGSTSTSVRGMVRASAFNGAGIREGPGAVAKRNEFRPPVLPSIRAA
jgi:hypothetical protein